MIQLENVSVTYPGGVAALKSTSLRVGSGEFVVLLGPSGAGKSTLLRSLNGLVRATTGSVLADGIGDISERRNLRRHRRSTAMIFQQHQLIGRRSALRNVLTGRLGYHDTFRTLLPLGVEDRRIALRCLDRVGLLESALRRVDTLSGGQQQRVGIARAIAQQPRLVLADEPVASLDPATSRRVLALIHDICRTDRIGAIVSLHQVELAHAFADRVVGIAQGAVVFDGTADRLTDSILSKIYDTPEALVTRPAPEDRPEPIPVPVMAGE